MANDDKKAAPPGAAPSNATDALLAETLGDVYKLSQLVNKLKEELPETSRSLAAQTNALLIAARNYNQTLESLKNETAASISEKTKLGIEKINKISSEKIDILQGKSDSVSEINADGKNLLIFVTIPILLTNLIMFMVLYILLK